MKLLLDTCIIIDYCGRREPFFRNAEKVMATGFFGDAELFVPSQSVNDAFYVLKKRGDPLEVQKVLSNLLRIVRVVVPLPKDYERAFRKQWTDLEDCMVSLSAEQVQADYIVTRDERGFEKSTVPAISPDALLSKIEHDVGVEYGSIDGSNDLSI